MKDELIDKWLNNEATPADFEDLRTMPEFSSYLKIDEYVKKLEVPKIDTQSGLSSLKERLENLKKTPKVLRLATFIKLAAILMLLLASYVFINSLSTTIDTQLAETNTVQLPDTSEVIVNQNSQLSFNKSNWNEKREVSLEGEAYFEVAKGQVFDVITPNGKISVLGTKFNVLSRENTLQVECFEGLVSVTHKGETVKVAKGKSVLLDKNKLTFVDVFVNKPVWIYNESSYVDAPVTQVLNDLESRYNVTVTTKNINVNLRFTGTFTHDNLEAALKTVVIPLELNYSINNKNEVTVSSKATSE